MCGSVHSLQIKATNNSELNYDCYFYLVVYLFIYVLQVTGIRQPNR